MFSLGYTNTHAAKKVFICFLIGVVVFVLLATPVSAEGTTLYANPGGTGDCTNWETACTLQSALTSAVSGDQIWVMAGTHTPTSPGGDRYISFQLKAGVTVYGGFDGSETESSQRDWLAHVTILSGDLNGDDVGFTNNDENSIHVVRGATGATLDGVTITGGNGNGYDDPIHCGGGVYNHETSPIITNVIITGNHAKYGAGMFNDTSSPTLSNVTFNNNIADVNGGGIWNGYNSHPTLVNVTFDTNSALSGGGIYGSSSNATLTSVTFVHNSAGNGGAGGGMRADGGNPTLTNVTFSQNSSGGNGGGLATGQGSPVLTNVTFSGNTSVGSGAGLFGWQDAPTITNAAFLGNTATGAGGGYYTKYGNPTLLHVTFEQNFSGNTGGGLCLDTSYGNPVVSDVTFSDNTALHAGGMMSAGGAPSLINVNFVANIANGDGGGLYNYQGSNSTLTNVTFSQNSAGANGGGLINLNSSPELVNVTFSGNSAAGVGGAIGNFTSNPIITNATFNKNTAAANGGGALINYNSSFPVVRNSILWGDINGEIVNTPDSLAVVTQSDVQGGYTGAGNMNVYPMLSPLGDYGGFVETIGLFRNSPVINATSTNCPTTDARGFPRSSPACDLGAFEYNGEFFQALLPFTIK